MEVGAYGRDNIDTHRRRYNSNNKPASYAAHSDAACGSKYELLINDHLVNLCLQCFCLQRFDSVGWAAGRASGL